jgi:hypothetical protein
MPPQEPALLITDQYPALGPQRAHHLVDFFAPLALPAVSLPVGNAHVSHEMPKRVLRRLTGVVPADELLAGGAD